MEKHKNKRRAVSQKERKRKINKKEREKLVTVGQVYK